MKTNRCDGFLRLSSAPGWMKALLFVALAAVAALGSFKGMSLVERWTRRTESPGLAQSAPAPQPA
jgi:hypothetical protein